MKQKIDDLVRSIHANRTKQGPSNPDLANTYANLGIDGPGVAREELRLLARWTQDMMFSATDRAYAGLQLALLESTAARGRIRF